MLYKNHNLRCGRGDVVAFQTVLFANGDDPTGPEVCFEKLCTHVMHYSLCMQHGLPALSKASTIEELLDNHLRAYCHGYYPGEAVPNARARRVVRIKLSIGCLL
jgi:hypothetical protein